MSDPPAIEFTITEKQLDTGLRGYPVGTCWTSGVDPQRGVSYVGYPIAEIAHLPPEDVIYLLFHKHLPGPDEAAAFRHDLQQRADVDPAVYSSLKELPSGAHPMEMLCVGIQLLGMTGKTGDYKEDALNLVARIPSVLAAIFRIREGWGDPIEADQSLDYVGNFVHMLGMPSGDLEKLTTLLRTFFVLHMDHGGGNLSTFTGKAVASGLADLYQSLASAMNGLAGPRHGRANQDCLEFVREVNTDDEASVERWVRKRIAEGGLIFGFGHAVLREEDPRAQVQIAVGEQIAPDNREFRIVKTLRKVVPPILKENPKIANPYPNVDLVSGSLLNAVGFTDPEYYTTLFGWARIAGIGAQIVDERLAFRNGKGVAIYRPKYVPVNQPAQTLSP